MNSDFGNWIESQGLTVQTRKTQSGHLSRLEQAYGDLDEAYDKDAFASILTTLRYTSKDRDARKPNPSAVPFSGKDLYQHLSSLRTALSYYTKFRQGAPAAELWPELEELKSLFLERCPDFRSFAEPTGAYYTEERAYKDKILAATRDALESIPADQTEQLGRRVLELIRTPPANFVNWRTFELFKKASETSKIAAILGELIRTGEDVPLAVEKAAERAYRVMRPNSAQEIFGGVRSLVTTAIGFSRPDAAMSVKTHYMAKASRLLIGEPIFRSAQVNAEEYWRFLDLGKRIFRHLESWQWAPKDLWDVQGFLWVVTQEQWKPAQASSVTDIEDDITETNDMDPSVNYGLNTILFGPPGTGKTFKTAELAVAICNGVVPTDRLEVMKAYRQLVETNRVWFTTFHQSIGYEEFVEGLRPVVASDNEDARGGGFQLEARNGIFREVCAQAEASTKRSSLRPDVSFEGRTFYKMSLGQTGIDDDIYQAALDGDYIVLGWGGDENWSDPRYKDYTAIMARWAELGKEVSGNSGDVVQVARFRSMKPGDIVIVPEGNSRFRAIGEIEGDYEFAPGTIGGNHRRKVRWLLKLNESLPVDTIYNGSFAQAACYLLTKANVKVAALNELVRPTLTPGTGAAPAYVLIIDEINRANISKVLGELITLLEPDKRLGAENEITLTLPYSKARFGVPKNLYLIGTMNTADRSIAPIDTALRRRFEFVPMMPDYSVLESKIIDGISLKQLLKAINDRIEWLFDRDHQLGHAFFVSVETKADLDRVMRKKVVPLIAEYFFDDLAKVRTALNDELGHFVFQEALPAPALELDKEPRIRHSLLDGPVPVEAYEALVGGLNG